MPKKIVYWECNICRQRYDKESGAINCEKKGVADKYPIGMICGSPHRFYKDITFATAGNHIQFGHYNTVSLWACRDNGVGDSLDHQCGGGSYGLPCYNKPDKNHPTFKRMVKALKEKGIKDITVWDGKKPVSLKEFLK